MTKNQLSPEQKKKVKPIIMGSGLVFILLGLYASIDTQTVSELINMKTDDVKLLSYAMMFVGVADLIVIRFLFSTKDRV